MNLSAKAQQEYDELGLPIEYLPNIATDAQEKFYVKAANQHHQLVAENGRLRSALKGLLDCIQETRGCDATDAVWKAREALKESK